MTSLYSSDELDDDLEYFDPDPHRHDICNCGHSEDDHTHNDGGCARRWCECRWYQVPSWP